MTESKRNTTSALQKDVEAFIAGGLIEVAFSETTDEQERALEAVNDLAKKINNLTWDSDRDPLAKQLRSAILAIQTRLLPSDDAETVRQKLRDRFTEEELKLFREHRASGPPSKKLKELYERRRRGVIDAWNWMSKDAPQVKRHCYYFLKNLLCGIGDYHSIAITKIINNGCWNKECSFDSIREEGRDLIVPSFFESATELLRYVSVNTDRNEGQRKRLAVLYEKDSMSSHMDDICRENHIVQASMHGQASDGGTLWRLCKWIDSVRDRGVEEVVIGLFTDFDSGGLSIGNSAFGTHSEEGEDEAKLQRMLGKFFPNAPAVTIERLGVTEHDLNDERYTADIILATKKFHADTGEEKRDGQLKNFLRKRNGDARTLALDCLSLETCEERIQDFVERHRDPEAWELAKEYEEAEQAKLERAIENLSV